MPNTSYNAAVVASLRHLRPIVQSLLRRDLDGTPAGVSTPAYANLIFAFGLARVGEADESRQLVQDAAPVLLPLSQAHQWLFPIFRYRIEEVIRGNRHGGLLPSELEPPSDHQIGRSSFMSTLRIFREKYAFTTLVARSRILEPENCSDPYYSWGSDTNLKPVHDLATLREPMRVEEKSREILHRAQILEPRTQVAICQRLFPFVWRCCLPYAMELSLSVPNFIEAMSEQDTNEDSARTSQRLLLGTLDFVSRLADAEPFPPLIWSACNLALKLPVEERYRFLAQVTWPCLRWFRKLDTLEEVTQLLHDTNSMWPDSEMRGTHLRSPQSLQAILAKGALEFHIGQKDKYELAIKSVTEATTTTLHTNVDAVRESQNAIFDLITSAALDLTTATPRIERLLQSLPRMGNTFTTSSYYSRRHLDLVEGLVLAFPQVGDY